MSGIYFTYAKSREPFLFFPTYHQKLLINHYHCFYSLYFLANISYFILLLYITRLLYGCLLAKDHPELRCQGDCVFRLLLTRLVVQDKYDVYVFLLLL